MTKTYSIHPNSHRIDKTNFPTKDEAISRALECARILNRGVSVYEVEPAGTNTQTKDFPKVTSPFTHIAFVLPDGTVKKGKHPAIELLEENPADGSLETYPYALGQLSKLVKTLDDIARHPAMASHISQAAFSLSDSVQNRIFESQKNLNKKISANSTSTTSVSFARVFTPGRVFKNPSENVITVETFNAKNNVIDYTHSSPSIGTRKYSQDAVTLSKFLLKGDFRVDAPSQQQGAGNFQVDVALKVPIQNPQHDAKKLQELDEHAGTLEDRLKEQKAPGAENPSTPKDTLVSFFLNICGDNKQVATELATAFLEAFDPRVEDRRTTATQLKAISSFRGYKLPPNWFVSAQRETLRQLSLSMSDT